MVSIMHSLINISVEATPRKDITGTGKAKKKGFIRIYALIINYK
jgi:hypothetical protein